MRQSISCLLLSSLILATMVDCAKELPSGMSQHQFCHGCLATMKELVKKVPKKSKGRDLAVVEAMENICSPSNFREYKYSPPKTVKACKLLLDDNEEDIEAALTKTGGEVDVVELVCKELTGACLGVNVDSDDAKFADIDLSKEGGESSIEIDPATGKVKTEVGVNSEALKQLAGKWKIRFGDTTTVILISDEGVVTVNTGQERRNAKLVESMNEVDFPSSEGWYKLNHLMSDMVWDYIRLKPDGMLEIRHFCSQDAEHCKRTFGSTSNYCCDGEGTRVVSGKGKDSNKGKTLSKTDRKKKEKKPKGETKKSAKKEGEKSETKAGGKQKGAIHNLNIDINDPSSIQRVMDQINKIKHDAEGDGAEKEEL